MTKRIQVYDEYHETVGEVWVGPDYQQEFGEKAGAATAIALVALVIAAVFLPLYGIYRIASPKTGIIKTVVWIAVVGFALDIGTNMLESGAPRSQYPTLIGLAWLAFVIGVGGALFVRFCRTGGFRDIKASVASLEDWRPSKEL